MAYRTVLIESNQMMTERLSSVIRHTKDFQLVGRFNSGSDALGQMQAFKPNLILLDVDDESNISIVAECNKVYPDAKIICIARHWDSEAQMRLMKSGASGYMIKPFTGEELQEAVKNTGIGGFMAGASVFSFFSPKGKSGKSTLISNLAYALQDLSGEQVAIIDADVQFGDMAVFLNIAPQTTIIEAMRDINFLSPITLKSYFTPVNKNLSVLCGANRPDMGEVVTIDALTSLVKMARSLYRYVLIDIPSGFSDVSATAAELSDVTYVLSMMNEGYEIEHMKRTLEIFEAWDDYKERVKPVFTRVTPCTEEHRKTLSEALGFPVSFIIPNEYILVSEAANNGRLVVSKNPDSSFANAVTDMAKHIIASSR